MAGSQVRAEMAEQSAVLREIAGRRESVRDAVSSALPARLRGVSLVARGSSDNVAVYARYLLELATGLPVSMVAPSIVTRYHRELDVRDHLVVALSQSGRTPEIVDVSSRLHDSGAVVVGITNDEESPLAGTSTISLSVGTGRELAVPATKTVTGQLALVAALAEALNADIADYTGGDRSWDALPEVVAEVLDDESSVAAAVEVLIARRAAIHLARGLTYAAALEGALKSKETSRRVHEGYSSADFLHGPLTVASPDVAVVAYGATGPVLADVADTASAAAALGSPVIGVGAAQVWRGVPGAVAVPVPQLLGEGLAVVPLVVRGQQLAVGTAVALGLDPDSPAGLNKVTATH